MKQPQITVIAGTRPEFVKLAPVIEELRTAGVATDVLATGQHVSLIDPWLLAKVQPVESVGVASDGTILRFLSRAIRALRERLQAQRPQVVVVQGDTMSAYAGAIVAEELGIPLAHVEAGVRSGCVADPWPEEHIRRDIDAIAKWHFAPTMRCAQQLALEDRSDIFVVGNTCVDAMLRYTDVRPVEQWNDQIVVTMHRREFRDRKDATVTLQTILDAIADNGLRGLWPVHPAMNDFLPRLRVPACVNVRPPLDYTVMLRVIAEARGVVTDSGGVTEEAATLGVPTAILRFHHDRHEAVEAGVALQFDPTPIGAHTAVRVLARRIVRSPSRCFGDGRAAAAIAGCLAKVVCQD